MSEILIVTEEQYKNNKEIISDFNGQVKIILDGDTEDKNHISALGVDSLPIIIIVPKGRNNCLDLIKGYGKKVSDGNDIKIEL